MKYPIKVVPNPRPFISFKKRSQNNYCGIQECADMNVHEQIVNIVNSMYPDKPLRILDIACGKEALAYRLKSSRNAMKIADEFINVDIAYPSANDDITFTYYQVDLNDRDQVNRLIELYPNYFDLILGVETIEHLDNPKFYMESLSKMLTDNGHIFISTPNINNPMSRRLFYKKGRLEQFTDKDLEYGHVSVILPHVIYKIANDLNLWLVAEYPLGFYPKLWLYPNLRSLYITFCNLLMPRVKGSWVKLYIFRKGESIG